MTGTIIMILNIAELRIIMTGLIGNWCELIIDCIIIAITCNVWSKWKLTTSQQQLVDNQLAIWVVWNMIITLYYTKN